MGGQDRGGGREGKNKSLRNNKIQIVEKVKAIQKGHVTCSVSEISAPPPAVRQSVEAEAVVPLVDCGVQLLNRQFDRDQQKVIQRAAAIGVEVMVAYTSDFEKAEALVRLAKENSGFVYCMVGIHTDMIKRSNDKLSPQRLQQLREVALRSETIAIFTGLDFSRDIGIRYAQERALQEQLQVAIEVGLPLVLYQVAACDALVDKIQELRDQQQASASKTHSSRVAVYNFSGSSSELTMLADMGCYFVVSGRAADPGEQGSALRAALLACLSPGRLLTCSDAPYSTPQNIEDAFMREGRNEPSNLPYLVRALATTYGLSEAAMASQLKANAFEFFGLQTEQQAAAVAADSVTVAGSETVFNRSAERTSDDDDDDSEYGDEKDKNNHKNKIIEEKRETKSVNVIDDTTEAEAGVNQEVSKHDRESERSQGSQRRHTSQHEVVLLKKPTVRSYLAMDVGQSGPRVTYACRSCRSILLTESDIKGHFTGSLESVQAGFKRCGKSSKNNAKQHASDQGLCSLFFMEQKLPWMQASTEGLTAGDDSQEGKLICPCCSAKLGRYSLAGGIACSCGVELSAPVFGLLRARLDLLDSDLDLARAVQSSLQLYEEGEFDAEVSSESDWEQDGKKKKKKQAKGRGNTSNFSSYRNKAFGVGKTKSSKTQAGGDSD